MSYKTIKTIGSPNKFGTLISAITLFVVLDLGVLILNYYLSLRFQEDAISINLAGRQRMLSQRITKSLLVSLEASKTGANVTAKEARYESRNASLLFGKTLDAFAHGGETMDANGQPVILNAAGPDLQKDFIQKANAIWTTYQTLFASAESSLENKLEQSTAYMVKNNISLLKLMNGLTVGLEKEASARASTLRTIQTIAMIVAIGNFALILFHFIRQLRQRDQAILTYADSLIHHLENVQRQVREEKSQLLSQLEKKDALVDATEASRRRRAVATALVHYLDGEQLMQALWFWEEDGVSRLPRISLFPYVKKLARAFNKNDVKEQMYCELTRCYALNDSQLDPDPLPRMQQWQNSGIQDALQEDAAPAQMLLRLMNYVRALDSGKAIALRTHLLSLEPKLILTPAERDSLRKWLMGLDETHIPALPNTQLRRMIDGVHAWCKTNFPPLVSEQILRVMA